MSILNAEIAAIKYAPIFLVSSQMPVLGDLGVGVWNDPSPKENAVAGQADGKNSTPSEVAKGDLRRSTTTLTFKGILVPKELYSAWVCESAYDRKSEPQQFNPDGLPRTNLNKNGSRDWGIAQINDRIWDARAKELALDYKNVEADNINMGIIVWDTQGLGAYLGYDAKTGKCL